MNEDEKIEKIIGDNICIIERIDGKQATSMDYCEKFQDLLDRKLMFYTKVILVFLNFDELYISVTINLCINKPHYIHLIGYFTERTVYLNGVKKHNIFLYRWEIKKEETFK